MKFKVLALGQTLLVSAEQLEVLVETLGGCEQLLEEYVGNNKGDNGSNYKYLLRKFDISRANPQIVTNDQIETYRLVTKLWDDERSANN
jgi:hypothetical protein